MSTVIIILFLLVIAVLLARWARERQSPGAVQHLEELPPHASTWHCVAIQRGKDSCAAARVLAGKRFLPREAPQLPLSVCTSAACECAYLHFKDRRHSKRRAVDEGLATSPYDGAEFGGTERREPKRDLRRDPDKQQQQPRNEATDYFNR